MGLKESLKRLQEQEQIDKKLSLKRELNKELTKIKKEKISQKKCIECNGIAKYSIKGSNEWYCKDCALEYFGELKNLKRNDQTKPRQSKKKSLRIYVAAKFEKRSSVQYIYKKIQDMGHDVAYDWTAHDPIKPYDRNIQKARAYCENELSGIASCDIFIYIAEDHATTLPMEFGAALAYAKSSGRPRIFVVGEFNSRSPWYFNDLVIRKDSIKEVLKEI